MRLVAPRTRPFGKRVRWIETCLRIRFESSLGEEGSRVKDLSLHLCPVIAAYRHRLRKCIARDYRNIHFFQPSLDNLLLFLSSNSLKIAILKFPLLDVFIHKSIDLSIIWLLSSDRHSFSFKTLSFPRSWRRRATCMHTVALNTRLVSRKGGTTKNRIWWVGRGKDGRHYSRISCEIKAAGKRRSIARTGFVNEKE